MHILLLLPALALTLAADEPIPLQAGIQRVRLHPDEAWVTRVGRVRLPAAGTFRLLVKDLPQGLSLDDLRVSGKGPEGSRLGDVAVGSEPRVVKETPEWKVLDKERDALRDRQFTLEASGESVGHELEFLRGLRSSYKEDVSSRISTLTVSAGTVLDLSRGIQARMAELMLKQKREQQELRRLQEDLRRLEQEMGRRSGELQQSPSRATVEFTSPRAGEVELELTYRSRQARWSPAYEARLSPDRKKLELTVFAAVTQSSREPWEGVQLEISNVRASRSLALPRYPGARQVGWVLEPPSPPRPAPMMRAEATVEVVPAQNMYVAPAPPPAEAPMVAALATAATTHEEAKGLATTWVLPGSKDVPADGEPHRFKLLAKDLDPDSVLVAVPRMDPTVHMVARFPAPSGVPLFPGAPIVQYVGAQRLGQTQLLVPAAGLPFELGFGPYRGMRVSLARLDARKEQVGAFTKERQWTLQERIEVSNDTDDALDVEIQDRILKSTVDALKVTLTSESTPGQERIPGVRSWLLKLAPKSRETVQLGTVIRAPQEGILTGLQDLNLPR